MIWHVMVWSIWKSLNDIVLSRSSLTQKEVEDMCIFLAKKWYRNRPVEYGQRILSGFLTYMGRVVSTSIGCVLVGSFCEFVVLQAVLYQLAPTLCFDGIFCLFFPLQLILCVNGVLFFRGFLSCIFLCCFSFGCWHSLCFTPGLSCTIDFYVSPLFISLFFLPFKEKYTV